MQETFGTRFQRLRKRYNLTQEEVAQKVNVSAQAVSKWENDLSAPDISILPTLADLFHISLDELLGREVTKTEIIPKDQRKNIDDMLFKINVDSAEGDRVRVKLPVSIIKICLESGVAMPSINGKDILSQIDFEKIFALVEQGVIGELISVDSADGDKIRVTVE
ncbi:MAG: helix-turn-helix domain-containing protein [Anaeroplasmataceae bacterium]|nr:helix-turn-helix domain-containing protein [Anaeroplasmataceae bacterium]MDE7385431.1 helix-turn-helix domain-containing protein [Anaeroplasmataceae bacterium]